MGKAIITFMGQAGFGPRYGRRLASDMAAAGLTDVRGQGRYSGNRLKLTRFRLLQTVLRGSAGCRGQRRLGAIGSARWWTEGYHPPDFC